MPYIQTKSSQEKITESSRIAEILQARTISENRNTDKEVDFVIEHLKLKPGAHVLDVPCGTGRHSTALAKRGYRVTGIDISEESILLAKESSKALGEQLLFINDDMRNINSRCEFEGGFCFGDSFGYFDFGASETFIEALARALKPGSRLLIDTSSVAEVLIPNLKKDENVELDSNTVRISNTYHAESSCLESIFTITTENGQTGAHTELRWIFTAGEITRMLGKAGLLVAGLYGSLDGEAFELGANRLLILAQKR